PVSSQIANVVTLDTGEAMAVSTVGRQGVTGLAAFLAGAPIGWDAVTYNPGVVWSLPAAKLREQAMKAPNYEVCSSEPPTITSANPTIRLSARRSILLSPASLFGC